MIVILFVYSFNKMSLLIRPLQKEGTPPFFYFKSIRFWQRSLCHCKFTEVPLQFRGKYESRFVGVSLLNLFFREEGFLSRRHFYSDSGGRLLIKSVCLIESRHTGHRLFFNPIRFLKNFYFIC